MPSKNVVKQFEADAMYHVYNRGVNKMDIFTDERDYAVFLSFLKYALLSNEDTKRTDEVDPSLLTEAQRFNLRREGLADKLELVSFCLMPNHFHLLIYQHEPDAITRLMRSVATGYSMYYNKRHKRIGSLFQGVYKASHINSDMYWSHISRYIHLNPLDIGEEYKKYKYSSYRLFTGEANAEWVKPGLVKDGFRNTKEYEKFVKDWIPHRSDLKALKGVLANSREITVQG